MAAATGEGPDWSATELGARAGWPASLRAATAIVEALDAPALLAWGERQTVAAASRSLAERAGRDSLLGRPLGDLTDLADRGLAAAIADALSGRSSEPARQRPEAEAVPLIRVSAIGDDPAGGLLVEFGPERAEAPGLAYEVEHRMRNVLAVIRSIVRRTAGTSRTVEEFSMHLEGRIEALSRVQMFSAREMALGIDLEMMVAEELAAAAAHEGKTVTIAGPPVRVRARAAPTIALALHELATNAVKFGALADSGGRLSVVWVVHDGEAPCLAIDWRETCTQAAEPMGRRGFGFDVIERTLTYELHARSQVSIESGGLACRICLPLRDGIVEVLPAVSHG